MLVPTYKIIRFHIPEDNKLSVIDILYFLTVQDYKDIFLGEKSYKANEKVQKFCAVHTKPSKLNPQHQHICYAKTICTALNQNIKQIQMLIHIQSYYIKGRPIKTSH